MHIFHKTLNSSIIFYQIIWYYTNILEYNTINYTGFVKKGVGLNSWNNMYLKYRYKKLKFFKLRLLGARFFLRAAHTWKAPWKSSSGTSLKQRVEAVFTYATCRCLLRAVFTLGNRKCCPENPGTFERSAKGLRKQAHAFVFERL